MSENKENVEIDLLELVLKQQEEINRLIGENLRNTTHINMLKTDMDRLKNEDIFYDYRGQVTTRQKIEQFDIIADDLRYSNVSHLTKVLSILVPQLANVILTDNEKAEILSKLAQNLNGDQSLFGVDVNSNNNLKNNEDILLTISFLLDMPIDSILALYK